VSVTAGKKRGNEDDFKRARPGKESGAPVFSFGSRRFASKGVRRLFVPQKCLMSPVFEPEVERPHTLLRAPL
jgi:hypothetical protein